MTCETAAVLLAARETGLEPCALAPAGPLPEEEAVRIRAWLAAGRHGEMAWLDRPRELADPQAWKPWARSVLLVRAPYPRAEGGFRGGGRVARYALGRDYHNVLGKRLQRLGRRLLREGAAGRFRAVVDAAPIAERSLALQAGAGFRGKNTLLLDPLWGPWLLLGELFLDRELPAWRPEPPAASCGRCTRCLEACPTDAFPEPWVLDARRCLSYLTIELRGPIPREFRPALGDRVFGCDVCLEVCPFGARAPDRSADWGLHPGLLAWSLEDLLRSGEEDFHRLFRGSPLRRAGWTGLLRNAAVVLGNLGRGGEVLREVLDGHPSALVRGHAAWALGRLGERPALERARQREEAPAVREEIEAALAES